MRLGNSLSSRDTHPILQYVPSSLSAQPSEQALPELGILPCKVTEGTWVKQALFLLSLNFPSAPQLAPFLCSVNRLLLKSYSALWGFQIQNLLDTCKSLFLPPRAFPHPLELDIVVPFWRLLYMETHQTRKQRSYYLTEPCSWECGRQGERRGSTKGDSSGGLVAVL